MKTLTKKQQQLADNAVRILHKLQDMGVEIMCIVSEFDKIEKNDTTA